MVLKQHVRLKIDSLDINWLIPWAVFFLRNQQVLRQSRNLCISWNPKFHYHGHRDLHLMSLSSASWIEFMSPYPICFISILVLYSHLGVVLQKVCIHFSLPPSCHTHFMLLDLMSWMIFDKEYKSSRSWLCNFSSSLLLPPSSAQISYLVGKVI
jgi:hypothetical protein